MIYLLTLWSSNIPPRLKVSTKAIIIFANSLFKDMIITMTLGHCMRMFCWIDCWAILLVMSGWSRFLFKYGHILLCSILRLKSLIQWGNSCMVLYISILFPLLCNLCFVMDRCYFCIVWVLLIITSNREGLHRSCSTYHVPIPIYGRKVRVMKSILAFRVSTILAHHHNLLLAFTQLHRWYFVRITSLMKTLWIFDIAA